MAKKSLAKHREHTDNQNLQRQDRVTNTLTLSGEKPSSLLASGLFLLLKIIFYNSN